MTSNRLPNINELSRVAEDIYKSIPSSEIEENQGKFIAIELESRKYYFGDSKDIAVSRAKEQHGDKIVFVRRVGAIERIQSLRGGSILRQGAYATHAGLL